MTTIEQIRKMTDVQIEISFITLGVFFNKSERINNQSKPFESLSKEGIIALKNEGIEFNDEFTISQLKDLLKVEMLKRGIE